MQGQKPNSAEKELVLGSQNPNTLSDEESQNQSQSNKDSQEQVKGDGKEESKAEEKVKAKEADKIVQKEDELDVYLQFNNQKVQKDEDLSEPREEKQKRLNISMLQINKKKYNKTSKGRDHLKNLLEALGGRDKDGSPIIRDYKRMDKDWIAVRHVEYQLLKEYDLLLKGKVPGSKTTSVLIHPLAWYFFKMRTNELRELTEKYQGKHQPIPVPVEKLEQCCKKPTERVFKVFRYFTPPLPDASYRRDLIDTEFGQELNPKQIETMVKFVQKLEKGMLCLHNIFEYAINGEFAFMIDDKRGDEQEDEDEIDDEQEDREQSRDQSLYVPYTLKEKKKKPKSQQKRDVGNIVVEKLGEQVVQVEENKAEVGKLIVKNQKKTSSQNKLVLTQLDISETQDYRWLLQIVNPLFVDVLKTKESQVVQILGEGLSQLGLIPELQKKNIEHQFNMIEQLVTNKKLQSLEEMINYVKDNIEQAYQIQILFLCKEKFKDKQNIVKEGLHYCFAEGIIPAIVKQTLNDEQFKQIQEWFTNNYEKQSLNQEWRKAIKVLIDEMNKRGILDFNLMKNAIEEDEKLLKRAVYSYLRNGIIDKSEQITAYKEVFQNDNAQRLWNQKMLSEIKTNDYSTTQLKAILNINFHDDEFDEIKKAIEDEKFTKILSNIPKGQVINAFNIKVLFKNYHKVGKFNNGIQRIEEQLKIYLETNEDIQEISEEDIRGSLQEEVTKWNEQTQNYAKLELLNSLTRIKNEMQSSLFKKNKIINKSFTTIAQNPPSKNFDQCLKQVKNLIKFDCLFKAKDLNYKHQEWQQLLLSHLCLFLIYGVSKIALFLPTGLGKTLIAQLIGEFVLDHPFGIKTTYIVVPDSYLLYQASHHFQLCCEHLLQEKLKYLTLSQFKQHILDNSYTQPDRFYIVDEFDLITGTNQWDVHSESKTGKPVFINYTEFIINCPHLFLLTASHSVENTRAIIDKLQELNDESLQRAAVIEIKDLRNKNQEKEVKVVYAKSIMYVAKEVQAMKKTENLLFLTSGDYQTQELYEYIRDLDKVNHFDPVSNLVAFYHAEDKKLGVDRIYKHLLRLQNPGETSLVYIMGSNQARGWNFKVDPTKTMKVIFAPQMLDKEMVRQGIGRSSRSLDQTHNAVIYQKEIDQEITLKQLFEAQEVYLGQFYQVVRNITQQWQSFKGGKVCNIKQEIELLKDLKKTHEFSPFGEQGLQKIKDKVKRSSSVQK